MEVDQLVNVLIFFDSEGSSNDAERKLADLPALVFPVDAEMEQAISAQTRTMMRYSEQGPGSDGRCGIEPRCEGLADRCVVCARHQQQREKQARLEPV